MTFAQPGSTEGDRWDLKNNGQSWLGTLFLIMPKDVIKDFDTGQYKPTDVTVADILFVDGPDAGTVLHGAWIFAKWIVAETRDHVGSPVLGRLSERQGKEGKGWSLQKYTDADVALATPILNQYQAGAFSQPATAPAAAPASPSPWNLPQAPQSSTGWNPSPTPAPAPATVTAPATALDPQLVEFLKAKGVDPTNLDPQTAAMIAATLQ